MERYIIYDDNRFDADSLKSLLNGLIPEVTVDVACDRKTASELVENNSYSVVFMDIELDDNNNGIAMADNLQQRGLDFSLVYITAHSKYFEEIFLTRPEAFIGKPFDEEKVKRVLKILEKKNRKSFFTVRTSRYESQSFSHNEIMMIEHSKRQLSFYNSDGDNVCSLYDGKLSDYIPDLPEYFVRCHQSFAVNMNFIKSVKRTSLTMTDGKIIPVSQRFYKSTYETYMNFLKNKI